MDSKIDSGNDAASGIDLQLAELNSAFRLYFDPKQPFGFQQGGNLPHMRQDGSTYFVTWRTADSIPRERVDLWLQERKSWLKNHPEPHNLKTKGEYDLLFNVRWERWLDECHGECLLRRSDLKEVVEGALRYFSGERYMLEESVVMPNHAHVLVTPIGDNDLSKVIQNWKSYTAHEINKIIGQKGEFWQKESYDHLVRNDEELARIKKYILENVDAASSPR